MSKSTIGGFSSGILNPSLDASIEIDRYRYALKDSENMMVDRLGGIKNRPGTEHVCVSVGGKLVPFQFNVEQSYMLEIGTTTMQVIRDGSQVLTNLVDTTVYKWTVSPSTAGEYYLELAAGGDPGILETQYLLEDGSKMTVGTLGALAEGEWKWGNNDTLGYNTPYVRIVGTTDPDAESTGYIQAPVLIASPLTDITNLNYTQSADTLYLTNGVDAPYKLTRTSDVDWTFTEIAFEDGPYKARVPRVDEDIRIEAAFISGTTWEFTSSTAIFDDVEVGEPFRLGFQIPGAPDALYWSWFIVSTVTSGLIVRGALQGDDRIVFQQVDNPFFKKSTTFWTDTSDSGSALSYDFTNKAAVLTDGAGGSARMEQSFLTFSNVGHSLSVNIAALTGAAPQITLKVGTASGLSDIYLSPAPLTSTGNVSVSVKPTVETVYLSIDTTGSTDADVAKIGSVEFYPSSEDPIGGVSHTTTDWRLAAWNSTHGYPSVVEFEPNSDRLMFGATPSEPQSVWLSKVGDYENMGFSTPIINSDSFGITLNARQLNAIEWLLPIDDTAIGTKGGLWRLSGGANYVPLTPTSISAKVQNKTQCAAIYPEIIGKSIILIERNLTRIKEMSYSLDSDGYEGRDLTFLASHLFHGLWDSSPGTPGDRLATIKLVDMAYAESPDSVLWCVQNNGELLGMTYDKSIDMWAWHKHTTAGVAGFKQVSVIPGEDNVYDDTRDDVYFRVSRFNLDAPPPFQEYHIERLGRRIEDSGRFKYLALDDSYTYDSAATTTVSGLDWFGSGATVTVVADGKLITGVTVTGGTITLDVAASVIHIGRSYTAYGTPFNLDFVSNQGSTQGKLKAVTGISVYFEDSRGASVHTSSRPDDEWPIEFNNESNGQDPPPLFTGVKEVNAPGDYKFEDTVTITQASPFPIHVKRIVANVDYER